jgi:hypothetical protein
MTRRMRARTSITQARAGQLWIRVSERTCIAVANHPGSARTGGVRRIRSDGQAYGVGTDFSAGW